MLADYRADKLNLLKKRFQTVSSNDLDAVQALSGEISAEIADLKNIKEVGVIFHLHSVREICCCCAYSIAQELMHGDLSAEVIEAMKSHNKAEATEGAKANNEKSEMEPFFLVMASATQRLTTDSRPGIGEGHVLEGALAIERKFFLQRILQSSP